MTETDFRSDTRALFRHCGEILENVYIKGEVWGDGAWGEEPPSEAVNDVLTEVFTIDNLDDAKLIAAGMAMIVLASLDRQELVDVVNIAQLTPGF